MLLSARNPQQGINGDLQRGHTAPHHEQRNDSNGIRGVNGKTESSQSAKQKCRHHDRFFAEAVDQESSWNGHDTIGDEKRKWQQRRSRERYPKAANNVRNQRPQNVRQKRNDEKDEENQASEIAVSG